MKTLSAERSVVGMANILYLLCCSVGGKLRISWGDEEDKIESAACEILASQQKLFFYFALIFHASSPRATHPYFTRLTRFTFMFHVSNEQEQVMEQRCSDLCMHSISITAGSEETSIMNSHIVHS